jgi:NTE family protein
MLVGTSAGAINAVQLGLDPTPRGIHEMIHFWRDVLPGFTSMPSVGSMAMRYLTGRDGLVPEERWREPFAREWSLRELTFSDFSGPRVYTVATNLLTGQPRVFGDQLEDRLLDGVLASAALPPTFAPWYVEGEPYIDGAFSSNLPVRIAVERGADEIYALNIVPKQETEPIHGVLNIEARAIAQLMKRNAELEVEWATARPGVVVHLIELRPSVVPVLWNLDRTEEMIGEGRQAAENWFREHTEARSPVAPSNQSVA